MTENKCFSTLPLPVQTLATLLRQTKYPETPVVIDHLARIGGSGTVRDEDARLLCRLAKRRRVTVKAPVFYTLGKKQAPYRDLAPLIRRVFEDYGPRRH